MAASHRKIAPVNDLDAGGRCLFHQVTELRVELGSASGQVERCDGRTVAKNFETAVCDLNDAA
jgi:hypothetical protein